MDTGQVCWMQSYEWSKMPFMILWPFVLNSHFLVMPGTYSCLFVTGNIAHMAMAPIQIALLPEVINVTSNPQTADCSASSSTKVSILCSIENSTETYKAMLKLGAAEIAPIKEGNYLINLSFDGTWSWRFIIFIEQISNWVCKSHNVYTIVI